MSALTQTGLSGYISSSNAIIVSVKGVERLASRFTSGFPVNTRFYFSTELEYADPQAFYLNSCILPSEGLIISSVGAPFYFNWLIPYATNYYTKSKPFKLKILEPFLLYGGTISGTSNFSIQFLDIRNASGYSGTFSYTSSKQMTIDHCIMPPFSQYVWGSTVKVGSLGLNILSNYVSLGGSSYWTDINCIYEFSTNQSYSFGGCSKTSTLTEINLPNCFSIMSRAFCVCQHLSSVSLPNCTHISDLAFSTCGLSSIDLPNLISVGNSAFQQCYSLKEVIFNKCEYLGSYTFSNCSSLSNVILSAISYIEYGCFNHCYNLISLDLRYCSSIPILTDEWTFNSTPLYNYSTSAGQWGSIYVPKSLYAAWKVASYWSNTSIKARLVSV